jgi:ABC-type transport system involved in multi-copper enzyme maturation permease subunit
MVLEHEILPYFDWLFTHEGAWGALPRFLIIVAVLGFLVLVVGYVVSAARYGLLRGGDVVYRTFSQGVRELLETSPRRVWALTRLAVKEARRRHVEVALVVYLIILAFANWFLSSDNQDPAKLYISFVLIATTYLVLGIALLLSAFSLPGDFKSKTIYTVVTKPVRAGEIILGRILGFTIVGTVLLAIMGVCSQVFVTRSLNHTHEVDTDSLRYVKDSSGEISGYRGRTTKDAYHRHDVELYPDKSGTALSNYGHYHEIESPEGNSIVLGPEGFLRARRPQWGKLSFLDRQGVAKERGINVGNEWTYRSFIEGNTQAAAMWTFDDVGPWLDPDGEGLPIGLIVRVFRTYKGIIGQQIQGAIQVRNPETNLRSQLIPFGALDDKIEEMTIKRKLLDTENVDRDLFDDFVSSDRKLQIRVQCLEPSQYFGFAQPDCYLRLPDSSPTLNFLKVYVSIWVQMVIVTAIGVAASAVLSGPVAMLFTVSLILLGFFREFFLGVAAGADYQAYGVDKVYGGGPVEALVRIVTQKNLTSPLEPGFFTTMVESVDAVLQQLMLSVAQVLPNFSSFSTVDFAADGFSVPPEKVGQDLTVCLAYVVGLVVIGYFLLRTREVAK